LMPFKNLSRFLSLRAVPRLCSHGLMGKDIAAGRQRAAFMQQR
jgi:hypothetical protein